MLDNLIKIFAKKRRTFPESTKKKGNFFKKIILSEKKSVIKDFYFPREIKEFVFRGQHP